MQKIVESIMVAVELMGQSISPMAAAILAEDLKQYPENIVIEALKNMRISGGRFSQGAIVKEIEKLQPNGRIGADEAWSMTPRDEYTSVVMTDEMASAIAVAQPLLDEGDQIAARMAFKEAYTRITEANKRDGIKPSWFPSLGADKEGREDALNTAVRLGRISAEYAASLLAPSQAVAMLESNNKNLSIEHKQISPEQAKANIEKIKSMLKGNDDA